MSRSIDCRCGYVVLTKHSAVKRSGQLVTIEIRYTGVPVNRSSVVFLHFRRSGR